MAFRRSVAGAEGDLRVRMPAELGAESQLARRCRWPGRGVGVSGTVAGFGPRPAVHRRHARLAPIGYLSLHEAGLLAEVASPCGHGRRIKLRSAAGCRRGTDVL